jgi:subtilisin family serine protease
MKKLFFLLLLTTIVSCSKNDITLLCNTNEESTPLPIKDSSKSFFFWYKGEKHYLTPDSTKFFVVYNDTNAYSSASVINEGIYSNISSSRTKSKLSKTNKQKWQIIKGYDSIKDSRSATDICYESPFFTSLKNGNSFGISNLIHIRLKDIDDVSILESQMEKYNLSLYSQNEFMPLWFTVSCNDNSMGNALEICDLLYKTNLFAYVEPDFMDDLSMSITSFQVPNDPYYNQQWNLHGNYSINWPEASTVTKGENVNIGLIDQGVAFLHPDLNPSLVVPAYDASTDGEHWFVNGLYGSHGTNCAGIIAAKINNSIGITGICPNVHVHSYSDPLKERPNASQDLASDLYVALTSDDVVSCSWGGNSLISSEIEEAIDYYGPWGRDNKGTVLVFSSGNSDSSIKNVFYPANHNPYILVVGATDSNGQLANFSCYGDEIDVVAPGVEVLTLTNTQDGTYTFGYFTGTSAACPHVAAIAALVLSINPELTNIEVNNIIESTARKIGNYSYSIVNNRLNGSWNRYMGYGLVDAAAAVQAAQQTLN